MSPKVADIFSGHMESGDPRSPIFGCGGCTWPTVPSWRIFLGSTTAWGVLSFFNTTGVLLQVHEPHGNPESMQWDIIASPPSILSGVALKQVFFPPLEYQWAVVLLSIWGPIETAASWPERKCNVDHLLPEATVSVGVPIGGTGSDFKVRQVKWDETEPPGWGPP